MISRYPLPSCGPFIKSLFITWAQIFCILLLACLTGPLCAQTAWSIHPDSPSNLTSTARLKYANNSFRLVWQTSSSFPPTVFYSDLKTVPPTPTPFSLTVNQQSMRVDPAPGFTKSLTVRYATASGQYRAVVQEGGLLRIPSSSHTLIGPGQSVSGFVVLSATYGTATQSVSVMNVFQVKNLLVDSYDFVLGDFTYNEAGELLLFGGGYSPAVAYPHYTGMYEVEDIRSNLFFYYFYPSSTRSCGAYGNGSLVMGFSNATYSSSQEQAPLIRAPSPGSGGYLRYSWTIPSFVPGFQVKQIIYEAGKFVAVGTRQDIKPPYASKAAVLVSTDGVEWTPVVISGTTSLEAVCRGNGQWVAVGDAGSVLSSPNGFEWTKTTVPGGGSLVSVACGNGYCVVGSSSGRIYTSTDLVSWNLQNVTTESVTSLAVGDDKFMALAGTKVYQSPFSPAGIADIVSQPSSSFTVPQQSVTLTVGVAGSSTLSYQWYEGVSGNLSQPIDGATESSYVTPPLSATKNYWVRVSNGIGSEDSHTATLTMQAPPVITNQPVSRRFTMGASVTTSISVTGNNIAYQWYKGFTGDVTIPLAGKTSASLTLPSQVSGVSYYWVRVSNALGTLDSATARAEVTAEWPMIIDEPLDKTIYRGDYETLSVSGSGPSLSYQWYGGMSGDTSRPLPSTSTFLAPPYSMTGSFQFWVRVSNPVGYVDSRTALFTVLDSGDPIITRQPYDTTTYAGSSKSISVTASGNGLSYAWYAGESGVTSVLLSDSSSGFTPSYTVPGVYRYWVRISSPTGSVDSGAVTYIVKPLASGLISKHPVNASVVVDDSVSISVTASGSGLSYQWYSGVSGDTSTPLSGKTASSFSPPVSSVGQQSYWVRVTSGSLVANSETAVVRVLPKILIITDPPLDRSTYVGDSLYYDVYTSGSNVSYQWYSGMSGNTSNPIANATSYSFSPPVSTAGVFRYWMRATSGTEHVDSQTATVTVIGRAPLFTTQPQDQLFVQGDGSVSLITGLDYSTGATWQWYQGASGNTSVPLSGKTTSSLGISDPLAGTYSYWVRATNPYGTADSRTATVIVTPSSYTDWLVQNGLPSNGSGLGAFGASPSQDGVANLIKYALGMGVGDRLADTHGPKSGTQTSGGNLYHTMEFVQSLSSPGVDLVVQESTDLFMWNATAIECGPSYDNGDGTRTRTFRCSQPMSSETSAYLRIRASSN